MQLPKFIVIGLEDGGYMISKLIDGGEYYYEEVSRGGTDRYFSISELVLNANANYDNITSFSPYDDLF